MALSGDASGGATTRLEQVAQAQQAGQEAAAEEGRRNGHDLARENQRALRSVKSIERAAVVNRAIHADVRGGGDGAIDRQGSRVGRVGGGDESSPSVREIQIHKAGVIKGNRNRGGFSLGRRINADGVIQIIGGQRSGQRERERHSGARRAGAKGSQRNGARAFKPLEVINHKTVTRRKPHDQPAVPRRRPPE